MRGLSLAAGSIARNPRLPRPFSRAASHGSSRAAILPMKRARAAGGRAASELISRNPRLPRPLLARGIPRFHSRRNPSHEKCAPSPARIHQVVHEDPRRHGGVEGFRPAAHGQLQAILFLAAGSIARGSAPSGHFASAAKSFP